jgi:NADH-quinone oxidoreductase subunit N
MSLNYFFDSLSLLKPEVVITLSLCVIVIFDLFFSKHKNLLPYLSILGLLITGYFVISQFFLNGMAFVTLSGQGLFVTDSFSAFFKLLVVIGSLFIVIFSIVSKELRAKECFERWGEYYSLIFGMILGMFFMISSTNLILIYLSIELVSLSSYVLAGFIKTSNRSTESSLKYIIYGAVASGIMLFGISLLYGMTGSVNLFELNTLLALQNSNGLVTIFSSLLIFAGIGYKISAVPFHFWTPDVYEGAPTTITAYLSVASKAAGFALLIRIIQIGFVTQKDSMGYWLSNSVVSWRDILVLLSILTMTLGNFAALWQNNLKRMLAYSSIAHAGYLLAGLSVLSDQGVLAILIYFAIYVLMNLGAFFIVILIADKIGSEELDDYKGLGASMPFLGVCLAIFLVSLTGLPPTAGFIGKLYLFMALVDAKMIVLAVIALLNSVVSLYYYIRVLKYMFLTNADEIREDYQPNFAHTIIVLVLVIPIIFFGIYFTPLVNLAKNSIGLLGF